MAETDPYFDSAQRNVATNTAAMLKAIAEGGAAGLEAFKTARTGIESSRAAALTRAGQRGTDMGISGVSTEGVTGAYDERLASLGSAQAGFTSGLAATQASNQSYMDKVSASLPFLQAENKLKIDTRESEIKRAIEMAKLAAEQDAREEAAKLQTTLDRESRAEQRSIAREARSEQRSSRAAATRAAKPEVFSDSETKLRLGGATDALLRPGGLYANTGFAKPQVARALGAYHGLDKNAVGGMFPDVAAKTPVSVKNVMTWAKTDEKTAKTITGDSAYTDYRDAAYEALTADVDDSGFVTQGPYAGRMSPWEAYLELLKGLGKKTRTRDALVAEFSPRFSAAKLR